MQIGNRVVFGALGAATGLGLWAVTDGFSTQIGSSFWAFGAVCFSWVLAASLLALLGRADLRRAILAAAGLAMVMAALGTIAALRHASPDAFMRLGYGIGLLIILPVLVLPFLVAWLRGDGVPGRYQALFDETMFGVLRLGLALVAALLSWALMFMASALLQIVGIRVLAELLIEPAFAFALSGGLVGLALAVLFEILESRPSLILLRLLRLLVPFVMVTALVFLIALPINGFDRTFGSVSAAATLMPVAAVILALITVAIGTGAQEPAHRVIQTCTKALCALFPLVAACAVYAIWIRVGQYGWTPARLAAMSLGVALLGFGLMAALAVLRGPAWAEAFRYGNRIGLMASISICVAWMLPILRPEAISANSQAQRLTTATSIEPDEIWRLKQDWGKSGQAALVGLRDRFEELSKPDHAAIIQAALATDDYYDFTLDQRLSQVQANRDSGIAIPTYPEGIDANEKLQQLQDWQSSIFMSGCEQVLVSGAPACVVVEADMIAENPGPETIFFYMNDQSVSGFIVIGPDQYRQLDYVTDHSVPTVPAAIALGALQRGEGLGLTMTRPAIQIGGALYYAK